MFFRRLLIAILTVLSACMSQAQERSILVNGRDTISYKFTPVVQPKNRNDKNFDISFIAAPAYSTTIGLGVGVMASGLYRIDKQNLHLPPSTLSLFGRATLRGIYTVGVDGINIFKEHRNRLEYRATFASQPIDFWGLGYDAAVNNTPVKYTSNRQQVELSFFHRIYKNLYIGARANFDYFYTKQSHIELIAPLIRGGQSALLSTGISLMVEYDGRDFIPNPYRGLYLSAQAIFRPKMLSTAESNSWRFVGNIAYYQKLWKGSTLALDIYTQTNSKTTPWQLYARLSERGRMRGYYEGRFMDLNVVTAQVELRQKVWKWFGIAAWTGAGNCFDSWNSFNWNHTLPNYGIGLRWEFKNRINLRLDYGFGCRVNGRLVNGLQIALNEAF